MGVRAEARRVHAELRRPTDAATAERVVGRAIDGRRGQPDEQAAVAHALFLLVRRARLGLRRGLLRLDLAGAVQQNLLVALALVLFAHELQRISE